MEKKIQYIDSLRALAIIGVVIIHISSPLVNMTYAKNMSYWWIGNIFDSATRFAVPLFLMLSGATLLLKVEEPIKFYKRRLLRVFVPFVFWLLVYVVYRWLMLAPSNQPSQVLSAFQWAVNLFLNEGVSKHFWYIYMILFIYAFIPFAAKLLRNQSNNTVLILLICWASILVVTHTMPFNAYSWKSDYGSKFMGYMLHSGYLLLGYYLFKLELDLKFMKYIAALVYLLSVLFVAVATYQMSVSSARLNLYFYSYLSISTIIQSMALFVLFKNTSISSNFIIQLLNKMSDYSYGIYLVHIIIIGVLFRNGIYWSFANPLISLPALSIFVLSTSYLVIFLLRKIPGGKYISG